MKQLFFIIMLFLSFHGTKSQYLTTDSNATHVRLILQKNCDCTLQLAYNQEPFGNKFLIKTDTFTISINKNYSGFILYCNNKSQMFNVQFRPKGIYTLTGQLCDADIKGVRLIEIIEPSIKSFQIPKDTDYITNINASNGLEFFYRSDEELNKAQFYVIHNFKTADLAILQEKAEANVLFKMKYKFERITNDSFSSRPGDLVYTIFNNQLSFYYHTISPSQFKMIHHE